MRCSSDSESWLAWQLHQPSRGVSFDTLGFSGVLGLEEFLDARNAKVYSLPTGLLIELSGAIKNILPST